MSIDRGTHTRRVTLAHAAALLPDLGGPDSIGALLTEQLGHPPTPLNVRRWLDAELTRRDPTRDPNADYGQAVSARRHEQQRRHALAQRPRPLGEAW